MQHRDRLGPACALHCSLPLRPAAGSLTSEEYQRQQIAHPHHAGPVAADHLCRSAGDLRALRPLRSTRAESSASSPTPSASARIRDGATHRLRYLCSLAITLRISILHKRKSPMCFRPHDMSRMLVTAFSQSQRPMVGQSNPPPDDYGTMTTHNVQYAQGQSQPRAIAMASSTRRPGVPQRHDDSSCSGGCSSDESSVTFARLSQRSPSSRRLGLSFACSSASGSSSTNGC